MTKNPKSRERFQVVGSVNYKADKAKTFARVRKALIQQMDALSGKLESGHVLRDEERLEDSL